MLFDDVILYVSIMQSSSDEESGENGEVKEKKRKKAEGEGVLSQQGRWCRSVWNRGEEGHHGEDQGEASCS